MKKYFPHLTIFIIFFLFLIVAGQIGSEVAISNIQKIKQNPIICVAELRRIRPMRGYLIGVYVYNNIWFEKAVSEGYRNCLKNHMYFVYERGKEQNYLGITKKEQFAEFGLTFCDTIVVCDR